MTISQPAGGRKRRQVAGWVTDGGGAGLIGFSVGRVRRSRRAGRPAPRGGSGAGAPVLRWGRTGRCGSRAGGGTGDGAGGGGRHAGGRSGDAGHGQGNLRVCGEQRGGRGGVVRRRAAVGGRALGTSGSARQRIGGAPPTARGGRKARDFDGRSAGPASGRGHRVPGRAPPRRVLRFLSSLPIRRGISISRMASGAKVASREKGGDHTPLTDGRCWCRARAVAGEITSDGRFPPVRGSPLPKHRPLFARRALSQTSPRPWRS